jgi:RluA family pseudouridine synthase
MHAAIAAGFHRINVLFENDDLIAVDKPEKLASIPERNQQKASLLKILSSALQRKLFVVHRLDKQVSGVIIFAKNPETHRYLNSLFEHRRVRKTYLALLHGLVAGAGGEIHIPLRRFGSGRMGEDQERGKPCLTEFSVIERIRAYTLVRVDPTTGRKHQIRAHFYGIGHPVVGDALYGIRSVQKSFPRLMLHALSIRLSLSDNEEIFVGSRPPDSFAAVLDSIRGEG